MCGSALRKICINGTTLKTHLSVHKLKPCMWGNRVSDFHVNGGPPACIKNLKMLLHKWICFIVQRLRSDNKKFAVHCRHLKRKKQCIIPTTLQQISHHQVAVSWTICGKIVLRLVTLLLSSSNNNQTNHQIKMAHSGLEMWIREKKCLWCTTNTQWFYIPHFLS